jgi:hypothetical protein
MAKQDGHRGMRRPALGTGVAVALVVATLSAPEIARAETGTPNASETANQLELIRPTAIPANAGATALLGSSGLDQRLTPLPFTILDLIAIAAVGLGIGAAGVALRRAAARQRRDRRSGAPLEPGPIPAARFASRDLAAGGEPTLRASPRAQARDAPEGANRPTADDDRRRRRRAKRAGRSAAGARPAPVRSRDHARSRRKPPE